MSLYLHRACVSEKSRGDVYSGAWALPEGSGCCGRSLDYASLQLGAAFAEYGVRADSEWARELARRQFILATYDALDTGVVEDGLDGGVVAAGDWFQVSHTLPLKYVLDGIGWLPAALGANRENHIVRSSAVVNRVSYEPGRVAYSTFDAPEQTTEVLRLAFRPTKVTADAKAMQVRRGLDANGYTSESLPNGDCLVSIRHDGSRSILIEGEDPQRYLPDSAMTLHGQWRAAKPTDSTAGTLRSTTEAGASVTYAFEGNQVRLLGEVGPDGGLAEVELDGTKQLCGIDFWNPHRLERQVVFYRNGLGAGPHALKVMARGSSNPRSSGARVALAAAEYSAATGSAGFGEGGGPTEPQRWVFGYPSREPYLDSAGQLWLPATEVVLRSGNLSDPVPLAWYAAPRRQVVGGTIDPVLYRHGMHGTNFTAYFTVGPGKYHVRIKLMETRIAPPSRRDMTIVINDQTMVKNLDILATASGQSVALEPGIPDTHQRPAGLNQAVDVVFDNISPKHGVVAVCFVGSANGHALVSAIELGPGPGGKGAIPNSWHQ